MPERSLLLTGATGFVGGAVRPALAREGWRVRCLTRDAARAHGSASPRSTGCRATWRIRPRALARSTAARPRSTWCTGSARAPTTTGARSTAASTFSQAAAAAGVERIVYLGGVAPAGAGSEHLRSRLDVGEALRAGPVKTIELRASMIVGHGSLSWLIVRDLAARLPVMVLPRWLKSRTQPVAIDDVVIALVRALDLPLDGQRVVRHSRTGHALGKGDPRGDRAGHGASRTRAWSRCRCCRRGCRRCGSASSRAPSGRWRARWWSA